MLLHVSRWSLATLNLLLAVALLAFWYFELYRGMTSTWPGWLALLALTAATMASTGAGILLLRRRTVTVGLRWNGIVSICWWTFLAAAFAESLRHGGGWLPLVACAAVVSVWPVFGFLKVRLLRCGNTGHNGVLIPQVPILSVNGKGIACVMPQVVPANQESQELVRQRVG